MKSGTLYLVATPIGDPDDITLRALNVLRSADRLACEELKPARRLLARYEIDRDPTPVNEHTERERAPELLDALLGGESVALFSDAGSPVFSDPGRRLVEMCVARGVRVVPLPGATSLVPALAGSGFDVDRFHFYGWLSPKTPIRKKELARLKSLRELIVFMETPYRLRRLLSECADAFGADTPACLAYKLTMPEERFYRGALGELRAVAEKKKLKGEFVLMVERRGG